MTSIIWSTISAKGQDPYELHYGEDRIDGGDGADIVVGDDGLIVSSFIPGLPVPEARFVEAAVQTQARLRDLQQAAVDLDYVLFEAHVQVLSELIAAGAEPEPRVDHNHHQLFVGNDTLAGGAGNDVVVGDQGTLVTPLVTGVTFDLLPLGLPIGAGHVGPRPGRRWPQQATDLAGELAAHTQQDRVLASLTIAPDGWRRLSGTTISP